MSPGQFWGSSDSRRYHWILKLPVARNCVWLFYYFNFERNYGVFKSKSRCILLKKNITLIKTKRNQKRKIPHTTLERRTLSFSSYKNRETKVKLWWVGPRERKKRLLYRLLCSKEIFLTLCFILMYSVLNTLSEYTYFYISKKLYFVHFSLLVLTSSSVSSSMVKMSRSQQQHLFKFRFGLEILFVKSKEIHKCLFDNYLWRNSC